MRHDKLLSEMVEEISPTTNETTGDNTPGITVNDLNAMADRLSQTMDKKIQEAIEKASAKAEMPGKVAKVAAAAAEPENKENEEDNNQED